MTTPRVTAVMLTGWKAEREHLANWAVQDFKRQTYPNKQLLVITQGAFMPKDLPEDTKIMHVATRVPLGALWNLALDNLPPGTEYVTIWDDDDYRAPAHMQTLATHAAPDRIVAMTARLVTCLGNKCRRHCLDYLGMSGLVLYPANEMRHAPHRDRGHDSEFFLRWPQRLLLRNRPELHLQFMHAAQHTSNANRERLLQSGVEPTTAQHALIDRILAERGLA